MCRVILSALLGCLGCLTSAGAVSVQLDWDYAQGPETQATMFVVYKQPGCGGPFLPLVSLPVATRTYTDTAVVSGSTYCWYVTAKAATGEESAPSNAVSFRVPIPPPAPPTNLRGQING